MLLPISSENAQGVSQSVPLMQEKSCGKYGTVCVCVCRVYKYAFSNVM